MKNIKIYMTLCLLLGTALGLKAQNIPLYTQYNINPFIINPAVAGVEDGHAFNVNYRTQWTNFPTAPKTGLLTYTGKFNRNGLGVMLYNDLAGAMEYNGFLAAYNYHIPLSTSSNLSIGLSMQYLGYRLRPSEASLGDLDLTDEVVIDAMNGAGYLEGTGGLYYYNDNGLYAGLSAPNLIQTKVGGDADIQGDLQFLTTHYFAFAGYRYPMKGVTVDPSVLVRKVAGAPFQVELNSKFWLMNEQLMLGATYRTAENTLAFIFGFEIEKTFRLFYSYDASFSELNNYHSGSNEITLGVRLGGQKKTAAEPTSEEK